MGELQDLGKLAIDLVNEYQTMYNGKEIELPNDFKNQVKEIFGNSVVYQKYTAIVSTASGLNIYLPNHWFYIASFFTKYYDELQKYKEIAFSLFIPDRIKVLKNSELNADEKLRINKLELSDESKNFIEKFLVDYNWWGGGKTIDRGDFYVSPILNYAKLVNASQSYVADLCAFLSQNKSLVDCLFKEIDNNKLIQNEEILFGPTQFGSNSKGFVAFLKDVFSYIIKEDSSLSRLTSIKDNYVVTPDSFIVGGCVVGKNVKCKDKLRTSDYDDTVIWNFENETYVFYKELTQESVLKFSEKFNIAYDGLYRIESKHDGKSYIFQFVKYGVIIPDIYYNYLSAIYTKPFVLLAGISGTGKSRIVRQLARACDNLDENSWTVQKPMNFEMIQVKPNWHDSSELLGYVSRIDGERFVVGDFLKFIVKAWENLDTPFFLCLDEMNLAPVEQYFAEYLSVIESRRLNEDGDIVTDPIVKRDDAPWYSALVKNLTKNQDLRDKFEKEGISIPQNLIVMGTVNMDETTFSFSRKVLDRAMTIEMNEVDLAGGLTEDDLKKEQFTIAAEDVLPKAVEGKDVYGENKELCDKVIEYLGGVNNVLEGTPFKIAYRTRNEFLIYAVNRGEANYAKAMDEMTSMKILSRIEGDEAKMLNIDGRNILVELDKLLTAIGLTIETSLSRKKIQEMQKRLGTGYTSYWS